MTHYQELTLLQHEDVPLFALWGKVYVQIHLALTELQAASVFYPAESEHDDYFRLHPYQGYCQMVIAPKVLHARDEFAHHWRQD